MTVVRFPPLPAIPAPPVIGPDPRQRHTNHFLSGIITALAGETVIRPARMSGFRASAVDVGAIQEMLGRGIALLDMAGVRERWDDDLRTWMDDVILAWVQRCKFIHMELEETGITITIETQDDCGYYTYEFDVLPGRG
jgi:hypothetical protein